jgi:hypothetical protein
VHAKGRWVLHGAAALSLAVIGVVALRGTEPPRPAGSLTVRTERPAPVREEIKTALEPAPAEGLDSKSRGGRSLRLRSTASGETWILDPKEAAQAPHEGLDLRVEEGGGVRVCRLDEEARVGFARGLQEGDVIRQINGIIVRDGGDVRFLPGRLFLKGPVVLVSVERGGRPICIAYKRAVSG